MASKEITETGVRDVLETMGIPAFFQGLQEGITGLQDEAVGRLETAATIGSGVAGTMAGMGGGLFEMLRSGNPQAALDQYRQIQDAMTFIPRSEKGLENIQQIGEFLEPVSQLYEQYGQGVSELTGSPVVGEFAQEFVDPGDVLGYGAIASIPAIAKAAKKAKPGTPQAKPNVALDVDLPEKRVDEIAEQFIRAYHGSPFDFEKFMLEFIGEGEGAQAYGWGLYFAQNPKIAKWYRDVLSDTTALNKAGEEALESHMQSWVDSKIESLKKAQEREQEIDSKIADLNEQKQNIPLGPSPPEGVDEFDWLFNTENKELNQYMETYGKRRDEISEEISTLQAEKDRLLKESVRLPADYPEELLRQDFLNSPDASAATEEFIRNASDDLFKKGRLYEVDIKAKPEELLDWDEPFELQSQNVKDSVAKILEVPFKDSSMYKQLTERGFSEADVMRYEPAYERRIKAVKDAMSTTGSRVYDRLADLMGASPQEASLALSEAGIKGINYTDRMSRGKKYELKLSLKGKPYDTDPIYARNKQELDQLVEDYKQKGFDVDVEDMGTSNFVIFDPRIIKIAKKYGIAVPVAGAMLIQIEKEIEQAQEQNRNI